MGAEPGISVQAGSGHGSRTLEYEDPANALPVGIPFSGRRAINDFERSCKLHHIAADEGNPLLVVGWLREGMCNVRRCWLSDMAVFSCSSLIKPRRRAL